MNGGCRRQQLVVLAPALATGSRYITRPQTRDSFITLPSAAEAAAATRSVWRTNTNTNRDVLRWLAADRFKAFSIPNYSGGGQRIVGELAPCCAPQDSVLCSGFLFSFSNRWVQRAP
jgi:hypothetical protein